MADWLALKDSIYSFYLPQEETPFVLENTDVELELDVHSDSEILL